MSDTTSERDWAADERRCIELACPAGFLSRPSWLAAATAGWAAALAERRRLLDEVREMGDRIVSQAIEVADMKARLAEYEAALTRTLDREDDHKAFVRELQAALARR